MMVFETGFIDKRRANFILWKDKKAEQISRSNCLIPASLWQSRQIQ